MKPLLLPTLAVSVTSVAACAVAAFYLSSALIPYVLAFAGFVEAMCCLVARRKADEGLVWLRVNYGLVLMSTGFLIGRSFEYLLAGSLGASLVFAAFAVCTLVGLAIGDWIRGRIRREVLLVAIGVISILHGFDSSGRSGIANSVFAGGPTGIGRVPQAQDDSHSASRNVVVPPATSRLPAIEG